LKLSRCAIVEELKKQQQEGRVSWKRQLLAYCITLFSCTALFSFKKLHAAVTRHL
jgi:hypothetical protein